MTHPLHTMLELNLKEQRLLVLQELIDETRAEEPTNQEVQLIMDRRQTELDHCLADIYYTRFIIARSN